MCMSELIKLHTLDMELIVCPGLFAKGSVYCRRTVGRYGRCRDNTSVLGKVRGVLG